MEWMWLPFLLIWCLGAGALGQVGGKNPCNDPKPPGGVQQEGCLVRTCKSGTVVESLAEECIDLIDKQVEKIVEEKLDETGCSASHEAVTGSNKYKSPGIIVAGGNWQAKVKLFKQDTKEVCSLPDS